MVVFPVCLWRTHGAAYHGPELPPDNRGGLPCSIWRDRRAGVRHAGCKPGSRPIYAHAALPSCGPLSRYSTRVCRAAGVDIITTRMAVAGRCTRAIVFTWWNGASPTPEEEEKQGSAESTKCETTRYFAPLSTENFVRNDVAVGMRSKPAPPNRKSPGVRRIREDLRFQREGITMAIGRLRICTT